MPFPIKLSPSPVHEAFPAIAGDPLDKLDLSQSDKAMLRTAEENVLDWTLSSPTDAAAYVDLLLQVLDKTSSRQRPTGKVSKLRLDDMLTPEQAQQLLYEDSTEVEVVLHYTISKLCEIVVSLEDSLSVSKRKSKVASMSSTFYPNAILVENWRPLLRLLLSSSITDTFVQRGAAYILACILLEGRSLQERGQLLSPIESILESFVTWMTSRLQSSGSRCLTVVTPSLMVLIVDQHSRELFDSAGGIGYLSRHLKVRQSVDSSSASAQRLYELCYCLWILSYDCDSNERIRHHFHRDGAVAALVDLVVAAPREKVVRLALASLRNLAVCRDSKTILRDSLVRKTVDGSVFLHDMVGCGLVKSVDLMKEREWSDPDLAQDLDLLHKLLHYTCREMTRFDVYVAEVESGRLQWSIIHTEKFFRENARLMEGKDGNFTIVRDLLRLVTGYDEDVAAIACYDIGEFARHYPSGRSVAKRLGVRDVVMKLLDHENPELQHHAILCLSKILVQSWESVV